MLWWEMWRCRKSPEIHELTGRWPFHSQLLTNKKDRKGSFGLLSLSFPSHSSITSNKMVENWSTYEFLDSLYDSTFLNYGSFLSVDTKALFNWCYIIRLLCIMKNKSEKVKLLNIHAYLLFAGYSKSKFYNLLDCHVLTCPTWSRLV